jgi:hypothetical protein
MNSQQALRGATLITTDDIRRWATSLPEVEETSHFRFGVPQFKVRGKTFTGLGKDATTAVFCVSEQEAESATAADPATCQPLRRMDARRSFLGLQIQLGNVSKARVRGLVEDAWRHQAPKRLVDEYTKGTGRKVRSADD